MTPQDFIYQHNTDAHYFGVKLTSALTLSAMGRVKDNYLADFQNRVVSLVSCLIAPQRLKCTYSLRTIARPAPVAYTNGVIEIVLVCKLDGSDLDAAWSLARDVLHLLTSLLPDYEFDLLLGNQVRDTLETTQFEYRHSIVRRFAAESLDTLKRGRRNLGFGRSDEFHADARQSAVDEVYHVFPFSPEPRYLHHLYTLLLLHDWPLLLCCSLVPTQLTESEEEFLEKQIAVCERYSQVSLGAAPEDLTSLWPTLREHAHFLQQHNARLLRGLQRAAALSTVEVSSPRPIPPSIIDAIGNHVASSDRDLSRGLEGSGGQYLVGGYDVIDMSDDAIGQGLLSSCALRFPKLINLPSGAERLPFLFDAQQLSAVFRLPPAEQETPLGLPGKHWRCRMAPPNAPGKGILVGISAVPGVSQDIRIGTEDRFRHVYVIGQTGTGKSTLLKTMVADDMEKNEGVCVIDPHGDLFTDLLGMIPEHRMKDVIVLDPTDIEFPLGLNLLECRDESQRHYVIQELASIIVQLVEDEFGAGSSTQIIGPMFLQHMRMNLLLAMSDPSNAATLLEFHSIFQVPDFWRRWLPLKSEDPQLRQWIATLEKVNYTKNSLDGGTFGGYIGSKFEGFVFDPMLRNIFGQKKSSIDLRDIMDSGKILLVNLAKGELTETNSRFFGMVLLAKLQAAAMSRTSIPRFERRDFHIYVDEFQNIATQSFIHLLSEARKFRVSLTLANQFMSQVRNPRIMQSILGNVGTIISFRVGQDDAEQLEHHMGGAFSRTDLISLPNWYADVSTLIDGQTVPPFTMETLKNWGSSNGATAERVRANSREKYGRSRSRVEQEIVQSLQTVP